MGTIAGTGMADWPITYAELEPYYTQAEWEMGISGQRVNSPFVAPMSKDYPVPPVPLKAPGALFNVAAAKLGLTVVPGPLAIITKDYMGRSACVNCGMCSGFGCHVNARSSSAATDASAGAEDRQLRNSRAIRTCARSRPTQPGG